jgi:hypothetical protein
MIVKPWGESEWAPHPSFAGELPEPTSSVSQMQVEGNSMIDIGQAAERLAQPTNAVHAFTRQAASDFEYDDIDFASMTSQRSKGYGGEFIKIQASEPRRQFLRFHSRANRKVHYPYPPSNILQKTVPEQASLGFVNHGVTVAQTKRTGLPMFCVVAQQYNVPNISRLCDTDATHSQYVTCFYVLYLLNEYSGMYLDANEARDSFMFRSYLTGIDDVNSFTANTKPVGLGEVPSIGNIHAGRPCDTLHSSHIVQGVAHSVQLWPNCAVGDLLVLCFVRGLSKSLGSDKWVLCSFSGPNMGKILEKAKTAWGDSDKYCTVADNMQYWVVIGECYEVRDEPLEEKLVFPYSYAYFNPDEKLALTKPSAHIDYCVQGFNALGSVDVLLMPSRRLMANVWESRSEDGMMLTGDILTTLEAMLDTKLEKADVKQMKVPAVEKMTTLRELVAYWVEHDAKETEIDCLGDMGRSIIELRTKKLPKTEMNLAILTTIRIVVDSVFTSSKLTRIKAKVEPNFDKWAIACEKRFS